MESATRPHKKIKNETPLKAFKPKLEKLEKLVRHHLLMHNPKILEQEIFSIKGDIY